MAGGLRGSGSGFGMGDVDGHILLFWGCIVVEKGKYSTYLGQ